MRNEAPKKLQLSRPKASNGEKSNMQNRRVCRQSLRYRRIAVITVMTMLSYAVTAHADDSGTSMFSLRGFGTLSAVHTSEKNADFTGNFFQPNGAGYSRPWAVSVDSRLGVQMDARFNDKLSAVVQIVSQYNYDSTYTPQVEWANVKYEFTPDFSVRAGRTVASPFMLSDVRLVGYAYPWIRPPQEVYGVMPFTNLDGIGAYYRQHFGDVTNSVSAALGGTRLKPPGGGEIRTKHNIELSDTLELGPSTFRISYTSLQASLDTVPLNGLFNGFTQFGNAASPFFPAVGAQALALGKQYRLRDFRYSILTAGMNYDPGDWLLMTEWAMEKSPAAVSDTTAWYVTGGYRLGKLTPYLTLAQVQPDRRIEPGISTAGLGPFAANAAILNGGLTAIINAFAFSQKSVSLGTRWDFMKNTDLKLQYDRVKAGPASSGRMGNVQPGFQPGGTDNVFSVAVDFVF